MRIEKICNLLWKEGQWFAEPSSTQAVVETQKFLSLCSLHLQSHRFTAMGDNRGCPAWENPTSCASPQEFHFKPLEITKSPHFKSTNWLCGTFPFVASKDAVEISLSPYLCLQSKNWACHRVQPKELVQNVIWGTNFICTKVLCPWNMSQVGQGPANWFIGTDSSCKAWTWIFPCLTPLFLCLAANSISMLAFETPEDWEKG